MTGVETAIEDQERLREELGLNDPFVLQFYRFTGDILQGDFGFSYRTRQPVGEMIASRIPATLELGTVALLISLIVGIPTGVYTALRPRGFVTQSILLTTLVGVSIPTFVIGIMLIFLFGVQLGWLPTFGGGTVSNRRMGILVVYHRRLACLASTRDHTGCVPAHPHDAARPCRDDGSSAVRLYSLRDGPRRADA